MYNIHNHIIFIGNNVPQDILKAISVAIKLNGERESARNQENARTEKMMRTIEKIESENTMQVCKLLTTDLFGNVVQHARDVTDQTCQDNFKNNLSNKIVYCVISSSYILYKRNL